jgi:hypothetical protein
VYEEVFARLRPGAVFCNLEHVASPTRALHRKFLAALDVQPEDEDPSNKLLDVHTQLDWLRGFCRRGLPLEVARARAVGWHTDLNGKKP